MAPSVSIQRRILQICGILILLVLLGWTLHDLDWKKLATALRGAHLLPLLVASVANVAVLALAAWRWTLLLRPVGHVRYRYAFGALVVGFALSSVLPARAGEVARVHIASQRAQLRVASVAGTLLLDYVFNGLAVAPLTLVVPFSHGVPEWVRRGVAVVLLVTLGVVAVAWAAATHEHGPPSETGWRARLLAVRRGFMALRSPRLVLSAGLVALLAWCAQVVVVWLAMEAFGIAGSPARAVVVLVAVNLALMLPAPPGNLGTFEVGAVLVLTALGVPREQAMAFALGYHALQLLSVWLVGWPAWAWARPDKGAVGTPVV